MTKQEENALLIKLATKAMQSLLAAADTSSWPNSSLIAEKSVQYAKALIDELKKKGA